jgi:hypothetical protein
MNTLDFHISTGKELIAIKDRVRYLINHWGEDGRYKEAVLKTVIQRFLPEKYQIATGFIVKSTHERGRHQASTQVDIIIYDKQFPVLFKENDFVIVVPDSVRAIIEVKANLKNQGIEKVVRKSNELGQFIFAGKQIKDKQLFNGVFSYAGFERLRMDNTNDLVNEIQNSDNTIIDNPLKNMFKVNHICLNNNWFYKYWYQEYHNDGGYIYELNELSFAFFISNLMAYLQDLPMQDDTNLWFPSDKSLKAKRLF